MKNTIEDFILKTLFDKVLNEERYDSSEEFCEQASYMARHKSRMHEGESPYILFIQLGLRINNLKLLLQVCEHLKQKDFTLQHGVQVSETYYEDCFKYRIDKIKKLMFKIRPFVLDYVGAWDTDRKQKDIDNTEYGTYFKNWYKTN